MRLARTRWHTPRAERATARFSALGEHAAIWLVIGAAGWALDRRRAPDWRRATGTVATMYALNTALKLVIRRSRPELPGLPALTGTPTRFSFPSAHASTSFAGARAYARLGLPASGAIRAGGGDVAFAAVPRRALSLGCARGRGNGLRAGRCRGEQVSTRIGIVGMPNAGKSSLFNALTKAGAEAANYPFTTIEPNVAVVPVRDARLEEVADVVGASEIVWDTIDFHDIAGLVAGAHQGEGLGNRFLANIRETDAIVHVVRAHADEGVVHPEGRVDPLADIDTIETELQLADLEQAERRIERVAKQARGGDKVAKVEEAWLTEVIAALQAGRAVRTVPVPEQAPHAARDLGSLTAKPVLFVANVDEGAADEVPEAVAAHAAAEGARAVAVSARIESELAELDEQEARAMRAELGAGGEDSQPPIERVVGEAFALLELIAFFTAGEAKPAQSWHLRRGLSAWHAAGEIHSDIQKGFVRAEVIGWRELIDAGGYAGARERGTLRLEGRDYVMADGEVITVKFSP